MAISGRKRKIVKVAGWGLAGLLLAVLALPLWFPWILRPAATRLGATYTAYERQGYGRFQLSNVVFTNEGARIRAERVIAPAPAAWLWRLVSGSTDEFVRVESWQYIPQAREPRERTTSLYTNAQALPEYAATLEKWIPAATLRDGTIHAGERRIEIPRADWRHGTLSATVVSPDYKTTIKAEASSNRDVPLAATIHSAEHDLRATLRAAETGSVLRAHASVEWLTNRLEAIAEFPREGVVPLTATVRADSFRVPASRIGLAHYEDLIGMLRADWSTNRFALNLEASAQPQTGMDLPAVDIDVRASGDVESVHIDSVRVVAPGLQAELSERTEVHFTPPFLERPAALRVFAKLDEQSWYPARGKLEGRALLLPASESYPRVLFTLDGAGVAISNVQTRVLSLEGELLWPIAEINRASIELANDSTVSFRGQLHVPNRAVTDGELRATGHFGDEWLPEGTAYERATLVLRIDGPLANPNHAGNIEVDDLVSGGLRPGRLTGEWNGEGLNIEQSAFALAVGESLLALRGGVALFGDRSAIRLEALTLATTNETRLELVAPAQLVVQRDPAAGTNRWRVSLDPLQLRGSGGEVSAAADVSWPENGIVTMSARALDSALVNDFIEASEPALKIERFDFSAQWNGGPADFELALAGAASGWRNVSVAAVAEVRGGPEGIVVQDFSLGTGTQAVARAHGLLPLSILPGVREEWVRFHSERELRFEAFTEPNSVVWDALAQWTGVLLREPDLKMEVAGRWNAPAGQIGLRVRQIEFSRVERPLPSVRDLQVDVDLERDTARLRRMDVFIEGQQATASGEMPLGEEFWVNLIRQQRLPDWRKASGIVRIDSAQLAPFAAFVPELLNPQGEVSAHLRLQPGGELGGELTVTGAGTRPLPNLGPIREIRIKAAFARQTLRLEEASGEVGGQRVRAMGTVDLREPVWGDGALPPFEIQLRGSNVPLARTLDLIVRADLELAVTNTPPAIPTVYGTVRLRDSFLLRDLGDLVPGRVAAPTRRPPYFSIQAEPWEDWRLDVRVRGDEFLRVRSPLFRGRVSTGMHLTGTLKDPIALGEARIDSGAVIFPFGSLQVRQGSAALTSADPYRPQVLMIAGAQRFGYEIQMEVSGPADDPVVEFSATPPLNSEQIVLMLTTGALPRGVGASTTQQRAQRLALFVGRNLLAQFGFAAGDEERLTIRSGEQLTETGRPTYEVEYNLTRRWAIIGEYDRFNQYNAGLKWRVYSR